MEPKRLGPFLLERQLGVGGMGTVYLARVVDEAHELAPGLRVALKQVHPHLAEVGTFLERFQREAEVGRQIDHENVVRTLGVGAEEIEGQTAHFLVMEYVEGRTLRGLLRDLRTVPEALVREIARQIGAGLCAIHEAGVVHRDLKPENVLITDDHRVRIMDLGVARLVEQSVALTQSGGFAGSLLYAAPEQFRGDAVGPAADLYSLGALLFELVTGEHPFPGQDAGQVIAAHLEKTPRRASVVGESISPFFSELLASLLSKSPDHRPASARHLREILDEGERSSWWVRRGRVRDADRHLPRVPVRRETALVGREDEFAMLREAWNGAQARDGCTVLVTGEAGIGKTRLVDAFLAEVASVDAHVLYGSYSPSGGLGGLSDAVLDHFGSVDLEQALRPYLSENSALVPSLAALAKHERPPEGLAPIRGDTLHALLSRLMRAMAAEKPLVWVVEDLHFAEEDSRRLVLSLARAAEGHRVLLLITTRPGTPGDEIPGLARLRGFHRVEVTRLGARHVIELLRDAFRSERLAEKLGGRIANKSDGVPFFVLEMIRGLRDGQLVREEPDGTWIETRVFEEFEVPSAIRDLVEARLRDLSDEDRSLLDLASAQGFEFDPDLLARTRGWSLMVTLEKLAAIQRRSGVIRGEGRNFRFDHHQIQEILYADLHESLRAEYHSALAEILAEREQVAQRAVEDLPGETTCFLAYHHVMGSRPRDGLPFLLPALVHDGLSYRNEQVLEIARHALDRPDLLRRSQRADVLTHMAHRLGLLGRRDEERRALTEALDLLDEDGTASQRAGVRNSLGIHLYGIARYEEARQRLAEAEEIAAAAGDGAAEGLAVRGLGSVLYVLGEHEQAQEHRERALAIARAIGDRAAEAKALGNLGNSCYYVDRYADAREYYEQELAIALDLGDRREEGLARGSLGLVSAAFGDFAEARDHYRRSLALATEIGDRQGEAASLGNLGTVLSRLGLYADTLECRRRHLAMAREIGERQFEGIALCNYGSLLAEIGDPASGRELLEEACELLETIGARRALSDAARCLGGAEQQVGLTREAVLHCEEALRIARGESYSSGVAESLLELGRLGVARGERSEATRFIEEALAVGRKLRMPGISARSATHLSMLGTLPFEDALRSIEENRRRMGRSGLMESHFLLWQAAGQSDHLEEAHRLLGELRDNAPEEFRGGMIENVPLHRDIERAWEERPRQ